MRINFARVSLIGLAACVILAALPAGAQPPDDTSSPLPILGQIGGRPHAVAADGQHAYVGVGMRIVVLDLSDPTGYVDIAQSDVLPGLVMLLAVADSHVFAVTSRTDLVPSGGDLTILDVQDPIAPRVVSRYRFELGAPYDFDVSDGLLCAATGSGGLEILDVSDPSQPELVGVLADGLTITDVAVVGDLAYGVSRIRGDRTLTAIDVSDPAQPQRVGEMELDGPGRNLELAGDVLVVATTPGDRSLLNLSVVDLTRPSEPAIAASVATRFNSIAELTATAGVAWVAGQIDDGSYTYAIDAFEVTASRPPQQLGPGYSIEELDAMSASDGRVYYIAGWTLHGVDVSDPTTPTAAGSSAVFLRFVDVAPADGWLYARGVDGPWGLKHRETVAFDVGDPAHPHRLGTVDIGWPVHVEGDYAVSIGPGAGQDDLCVVRTLDVADLAHPSVMGTVDVEGTCAEMLVAGHRAYVAAGTAVYIVDISRLDDPRVLGWMDARGEARHVAAGSEVVWVVSVPDPSDWHTRHLHAFDVSDEEAPTLIASTDLVASVAPVNQGPSEVVADGRVAWVADANRLRVLEIDSRLQLVEHASIAMNMDSDYLARDGNLLYVYGWPTETTWSVHVMDASNPRAPRPLVESGSDEWPFPSAQGMAVSPGRLHIVSFYSGIVIADTTSLAEEVPPTATGAIQTPVPTARPKPHSAFVPYARTLRPH